MPGLHNNREQDSLTSSEIMQNTQGRAGWVSRGDDEEI